MDQLKQDVLFPSLREVSAKWGLKTETRLRRYIASWDTEDKQDQEDSSSF